MNIIERVLQRAGYNKTQEVINLPGHLLAHAGSAKYAIPEYSLAESQADLFRRLSWVNIAVSMVSQSCATTAFNVKQLVDEDETDIPNHPFELLLKQPNPLQSRFEFLEATTAFKALTGNSYWWLNRQSNDEVPKEMWIIPPQQMKPVPDERMYLKGYIYDPGDGNEWPIPLHQVVHFKGFNPMSNFVGLSPVEPLATVAVGDLAMQKWNTKAFGENNARLPGMITFSDPIPDPDWTKMLDEFDENARNRNIMMMRNVGPGGVQWIQAALTQKEMEYLNGRDFTKEEIYAIFAPGLASMLSVNATEANSKTGKATFNDYALWPMLVSVAEKITNDLLVSFGENIVGEFEDIRYSDRAMELQEQEVAGKVVTINEMRQKYYQLDPLPPDDERGEMFVTQIAASPVGEEEEQTEDGPIPAPEIFQPKEPSKPDEKGKRVDIKAIQGELGQWQRMCQGRVKQGKTFRMFKSEHIPLEMKYEVLSMLTDAKTTADVNAVFEAVKAENAADYGGFDDLVGALLDATAVLEREKGSEDV